MLVVEQTRLGGSVGRPLVLSLSKKHNSFDNHVSFIYVWQETNISS